MTYTAQMTSAIECFTYNPILDKNLSATVSSHAKITHVNTNVKSAMQGSILGTSARASDPAKSNRDWYL